MEDVRPRQMKRRRYELVQHTYFHRSIEGTHERLDVSYRFPLPLILGASLAGPVEAALTWSKPRGQRSPTGFQQEEFCLVFESKTPLPILVLIAYRGRGEKNP